MSSMLIALMFGAGAGVFAWTKLVRMTGNAKPMNTIIGAAVVGIVAFLFCYSLFAWVLHI